MAVYTSRLLRSAFRTGTKGYIIDRKIWLGPVCPAFDMKMSTPNSAWSRCTFNLAAYAYASPITSFIFQPLPDSFNPMPVRNLDGYEFMDRWSLSASAFLRQELIHEV